MTKKILALIVAFCFLTCQQSFVFAQLFGNEQVITIKDKSEGALEKEAYKKFKCPSCEREFEIRVDPNDIELRKGIKKVVCPYDGTEFYPTTFSEKEQSLQYETVRCPSCGKEFKSYIDVKAMLSGQSQVLVCPYDKKKFYFKAEGVKPAMLSWSNLQTVMCPTDKRIFKAYIDPVSPAELVCPYDGTKFFPTPDLIVSKKKWAQGPAQPSDLGKMTYQPNAITSGGQQELSLPQESSQEENASMMYEEKSSSIEKMFSENIPLNVSTSIKQFGYDIFKPVAATISEQERSRAGTGGVQGQTSLLRTILGSRQQEALSSVGVGTDTGFSTFENPTQIPVINDYVLGPGDTLMITIWGQIQESMPVTIDSEGKILLPKVGPLYLWGLKFIDAEKLIRESLLKAYTNIQISVSFGKLRGIKVFVLGEAQRPGGYTISALSNSFHALYAAGGPSKLGSMRNIKFIRKGSPEKQIDLYSILLKGDNSQDYKLQSDDTIFIPSIGDVVGVAGNVKRPAIYELKEKTKLSDAIEMAGGISAVGYLQRIQIERIQEHLRKVVLDLEFKSFSDLKNSQNNVDIQDGDLVLIFPITPVRHNFISISGNILRPGDYELKKDMRFKDLLDGAGGMLPGTYLKRAEISRFKSDQTRETIAVNLMDIMDGKEEANVGLKEWDVVTVFSKRDFAPAMFVEIDGAVNKPGKYELSENMKISDLIFRAGGLKSNVSMSNAELFRPSFESGSKLLPIDLNKVLSRDTAEVGRDDLALEEGDSLFIREEVNKGEKLVIALSGEFKYPGKYAVEKGTRLSEVIERAGGFTKNAFLDGCVYTRESVKIAQQKMIRNFLESEQQALLQEQSSLAVGLTSEQAQSRNKLIDYRQRLMQELQAAELTGRVLVRLNNNMNKLKNSEYDMIIDDGDTLSVPSYPSTVQVVGNVYGGGIVAFSEGKGMDYYINKVGGLTKYADANRIFIIRANGETISSFVRAVKVKRGDAIIVPEEVKYRTMPGLLVKDIVQVLYQATLGAVVTLTAIHTL